MDWFYDSEVKKEFYLIKINLNLLLNLVKIDDW